MRRITTMTNDNSVDYNVIIIIVIISKTCFKSVLN